MYDVLMQPEENPLLMLMLEHDPNAHLYLFPEEEEQGAGLVETAITLEDVLVVDSTWTWYEQVMAAAGVPIPQDGNGWSEGAVWVPGIGYWNGSPEAEAVVEEPQPQEAAPWTEADQRGLEMLQNWTPTSWQDWLLLVNLPDNPV